MLSSRGRSKKISKLQQKFTAFKTNSIGIYLLVSIFPQLFDRFNEQRRLNLRRLILLGLDGRNSQMNGIRFLQSNIFHD